MNHERTDIAVIGAGQAGLAVSYLLTQSGVRHVVLDRGEIGDSWRSQRWDSFCLNTPNWCNGLPGMAFYPEEADAFYHRDRLVSFFERYVQSFELPVRTNAAVSALASRPAGGYTLQVSGSIIDARGVVLATGSMSRPRVPDISRKLPAGVLSLSAGTYQNPESLPEGAVVVVGTGQSGCQIAEDLLEAGRRVYVCASKVGRVPRTYRGREILEWFRDMKILETRLEELEDPAMQFATQPQVSGTNGGHTVSLQSLACDGATLLGRALDIEGDTLKVDGDLRECIAFADDVSATFKAAIDGLIDRAGIDAASPEPDPGEPDLPDLGGSDRLDALDVKAAGVACIVWCTGFDADWSWVDVDVFDEQGRPRHRAGVTDRPGLYFIGFPWLSKRKSGILYGVPEDAAYIVQHIQNHVLGRVAN